MTTHEATAINQELQDLGGLLTDLYARVATTAPGLAHTVAAMLAGSAHDFEQLAQQEAGRGA